MRKWTSLFLTILMTALLAGCARTATPNETGKVQVPGAVESKPAGEPGTQSAAQPAVKQESPASSAVSLTAITGEPVDWYDAMGQQKPKARITDNACKTDGPGLQADVRSTDWRRHPLGQTDIYWVPSAVIVVCNGTGSVMKAPLALNVHYGADKPSWTGVSLPDLQPGQAVGPLRIYSTYGFPEAISTTWLQDGRRWPEVTLELVQGEKPLVKTPVRRWFEGKGAEAAGGGSPLPEKPTPAELRQLSWSQGQFSPEGKKKLEWFLYAPDAKYGIEDNLWCGAAIGTLHVSARKWVLMGSLDGAQPTVMAELGDKGFTGGRELTAQSVPALGMTFFFWGNYGSCANPNFYEVYQYDHATRNFGPAQMKRGDGKVYGARVARYEINAEGKLISRSYNNAGSIGWYTDIYAWDKSAGMWVFEQHIKSQP